VNFQLRLIPLLDIAGALSRSINDNFQVLKSAASILSGMLFRVRRSKFIMLIFI